MTKILGIDTGTNSLVITAKRKACGIKNEMRFSDGKTKCAIKKHPSNKTWMLFC